MIFKAGNYYIADYVGNVSGPYVSRDAAIEDSVIGDTILIALTPNFLKTKIHKKKSDRSELLSHRLRGRELPVQREAGVFQIYIQT